MWLVKISRYASSALSSSSVSCFCTIFLCISIFCTASWLEICNCLHLAVPFISMLLFAWLCDGNNCIFFGLPFCSQVKKLVYVYLVRYAEEQQDLALLSISTFQRGLKVQNGRWCYCLSIDLFADHFFFIFIFFEDGR